MKAIKLFFIAVVFPLGMFAQSGPNLSEPNSRTLVNAHVHVGNGQTFPIGFVKIVDGIILDVGPYTKGQFAGQSDVQDLEGKHIYPGLIATNTQIGLIEIGAVRATRDADDVGDFNPNLRSIIAYNTDSRVIPTVRSNGIMFAQIAPYGGIISGTSSVATLFGWNYEDALYKADGGIYLSWPRITTSSGWWAEPGESKANDKYLEQRDKIIDYLKTAEAYHQRSDKEKDLKLEGMKALFDGRKKLFVRCNRAKEILDVLALKDDFDIQIVLVGAKDAWLVKHQIAESGVPVVLDKTHSLPMRRDADIDQPFKTPAQLEAAGILFSISMGAGRFAFWNQRNLPFSAGQAVGYGLDYEKAIQAITLNAAKILGIDDRTGSIEKGKEANIIVSKGDILDMRNSIIVEMYFRGRSISLEDKQKALYRMYMQKYGLPIPSP